MTTVPSDSVIMTRVPLGYDNSPGCRFKRDCWLIFVVQWCICHESPGWTPSRNCWPSHTTVVGQDLYFKADLTRVWHISAACTPRSVVGG